MEQVTCHAVELFRDLGLYITEVSHYIGHLPHSGMTRFTFVTRTYIYYTVES